MAQRKIIWSERAKSDLFNILEFFYNRNGTKVYSRKLNQKIRHAVNLLINHPNLGLQTDIDSIRSLIEGDYAIFYEIENELIRIITIWDCKQNTDNLVITK